MADDSQPAPPPVPDGMPPWAGVETFEERSDRLAAVRQRGRAMVSLGKLAALDALLLAITAVVVIFGGARVLAHPQWAPLDKFLVSLPLFVAALGAVVLGVATEGMMRNSFELHGGVARALLFGAGGTALSVLGIAAFAALAWNGTNSFRWMSFLRPNSGWVCFGAGLSVLVVIPWHLWLLLSHGRTLHPHDDAPLG